MTTIDFYRDLLESSDEFIFRREDTPVRNPALPLVTVITPVRNAQGTIARAVESVRAQTYPNIEHIIVDGLSNDGTFEWLLQNRDSFSALIHGKDKNPADALNKGIAASRGSLLCCLPGDDVLPENFVEKGVAAVSRLKSDYVFGDLIYIKPGMAPLLVKGDQNYKNSIVYKMPNISSTSIMKKRSAYEKVGLYDINVHYCPDYDWLLRAHLKSLDGGYDQDIRCYFSHGGMSTTNYFATLSEVRRVAISHGASPAKAHWYFVRGVYRRLARSVMETIFPRKIYYYILEKVTETGARPMTDE